MFMGLAWFFYTQRAQLAALRAPDPGATLACALTTACYLALTALVLVLSVRHMVPRMTLREGMALTVVGSASNLFLPAQAAMALRAVYLKKVHRLSFGEFTGAFIGVYAIVLMVSASLASICLIIMFLSHRPEPPAPVWVATAVILIGVLALMSVGELPRHGIPNVIRRVFTAWTTIRQSPRLLLGIVLCVTLQMLAQFASLWAACLGLHVQIGIIDVVMAASLGAIATLFSVTPGGVGIYEATIAYAAKASGANLPQFVAASLLSRVVLSAVLALALPPSIHVLAQHKNDQQPAEVDS